MAKLSANELERYDRQIMMPEIGVAGQEKLKRARVFVAGAGGLGSPIATYLAAAGVGTIRIVDDDKVDLSNLNRQILHWDMNIGDRKVASARAKLAGLNPSVTIEALCETITEANVFNLLGDSDLIIDAMDNFPTRYVLNKAAIERNIPFIHGGVRGFEGRAMTIIPGRSACFRCLYDGSPPKEKFPVIGVAPAVIGAVQATEGIKFLLGIGELLESRYLVYDGLSMTFEEFKIKKNPNCDHCSGVTEKE
jgi:adenylyltransferase/sulfurtransferase